MNRVRRDANAALVRTLSQEARFELLKNVSNFRMELIKCLDDPDATLESYKRRDSELHVHAVANMGKDGKTIVASAEDLAVCGTWRASQHVGARFVPSDDEMSMLVRIRQTFQGSRPSDCISRVRLKSLKDCRVFRRNANQVTGVIDPATLKNLPLGPRPKDILSLIDGELSVLLRAAGIKEGNLIDKIIQASSHSLDGLASQDADMDGNGGSGPGEAPRHWYARLGRIEAEGGHHGIAFRFGESVTQDFEIVQVFFCPIQPSLSAFEGGHSGQLSLNCTGVSWLG